MLHPCQLLHIFSVILMCLMSSQLNLKYLHFAGWLLFHRKFKGVLPSFSSSNPVLAQFTFHSPPPPPPQSFHDRFHSVITTPPTEKKKISLFCRTGSAHRSLKENKYELFWLAPVGGALHMALLFLLRGVHGLRVVVLLNMFCSAHISCCIFCRKPSVPFFIFSFQLTFFSAGL